MQVDTGGARIVRKRRRPPPRRRTVTVSARPTPDQVDRTRAARNTGTPNAPAVKIRAFAHPGRAEPQKVIQREVAKAERERQYLAALKRSVSKIKVTPVASPDARDSTRSAAQRRHDADVVRRTVAESRRKYLRKAGRGAGVRAVKRELEGQGEIVKGLSTLADRAAKNSGGGEPILGRTPKYASVINDNLGSRAVKDVVNLPGQIVPSLYVPAAGAYEKATGRPQRLDKFISDLKQHDPIYNAAAAGYEKAKGHEQAAASHWRKAKTAASEHPGYAVLEARGLRAPVGRGAGALVRAGAKTTGSETLKKIGTTERAPKTLKGTSLVEHRSYSPNLIVKAEQALRENRQASKSKRLRQQARRETDPARRRELKAEARRANPRTIRDEDIQTRVDEHFAASEAVRRINQSKLLSTEAKELKGAKKAGPVVSLLAQRITKPTLNSLKSYRNDLTAVGRTLRGAKREANEQLLHDLNQAIDKLESGKLDLTELKTIADRYVGRASVRQAQLTTPERAVYDPEEAARRAALPNAVREGKVERNLPLLKERERLAGKAGRQAKGKAKRAQGKASGRRLQHAKEAARVEQRLTALPQREPSAHAALQAIEEAGLKASQTQVTRATNRATKASERARLAKANAKSASALRRADPWLRAGTGSKVKTSTLEKWIEQRHGPGAKGAIVSQRPAQLMGGSDFYQSGMRPVGGQDRRYTGKATTEGTAAHSNEALIRQQTRTQALTDAFDTYKRFVNEFALQRGGGKGPRPFKNYDDAMQHAMDRSSKGDVDWTVVRLTPRGSNEHQLQAMLAGDEGGIGDMVQSALKGEGEGPWAVIPEAAAKRLQQHMTALQPTTLRRGARAFQSTVRRAVLATSIPWAIGNVGEAGFRSALNVVTPRHYVTGRRILKALEAEDAELAKRFTAQTTGGGHYAFADRTIYSNVDAMEAGLVRDLTKLSQKFRGTRGGGAVTGVWDRYTHHVFDLTRRVEEQFQTAMLGKATREHLMTPTLQKLSTEAVRQLARDGKLDTNVASKLGREIDIMYGKYSKWSPQMREAVAMYTPFLAWTRNAASFLVTAPVRHELATAVAAGTVNATEDERATWEKESDLPSFLRGGIPTSQIPPEFRKALGLKPGGHWKPGRFTPLGLGSDPLGGLASTVLPQFESVLRAMGGQDWTGRPLKVKGGGEPDTFDKTKAAVQALMDETIPFLGVVRRTHEKGKQALLHSAIGYIPPSKTKRKASGTLSPGFGGSPYGKGGFGGPSFSGGFK